MLTYRGTCDLLGLIDKEVTKWMGLRKRSLDDCCISEIEVVPHHENYEVYHQAGMNSTDPGAEGAPEDVGERVMEEQH